MFCNYRHSFSIDVSTATVIYAFGFSTYVDNYRDAVL